MNTTKSNTPNTPETPDTTRKPRKFPTRILLTCVVLGAFSAVIIHIARPLGLALQATVPWLAFPAPLPWFLGILIAPLLTQRVGTALITSIVATIAGFGSLALGAGIIVEAIFIATRQIKGHEREWPTAKKPYWLGWALLAATVTSIFSFALMFMYQEFQHLDTNLKLLALAVRILLGALYAWLAWATTKGLLRAGINPSRINPE